MRIVNNFEKRCLTKSFVKDSTDPCDRDHQLFIISTSGFISWRHPVSMAEALCEIPCSTINNNCHHHKLRLLAPLLSVLRVNKGAIKTTHYTLQTITSSTEHIILKISLYYKFHNVLVLTLFYPASHSPNLLCLGLSWFRWVLFEYLDPYSRQ